MPIDTQHPEYIKRLPQWTKCRDMVEGETAIKAKGEQYLPKLSGQSPSDYKAYKDRALVYNGTGRTVEGMTGLSFRKDPDIEYPAAMESIMKDITLDGISFRDFADTMTDDVITVGRAGVLVDFVRMDAEPVSRGDEERLGVRPYASYYRAESITNWRTKRIGGKVTLVMVVLRESVAADDTDDFSHESKDIYRALMLGPDGYRQDVWEKVRNTAGRDVWQISETIYPTRNGQRLNEIPFVFVGPRDSTHEIQKPPLYDLVTINISHYHTMAELENGRHWVGSPTPLFTGEFVSPDGEPVTEVKLGSSEGIHMTEGSDAKFLEFSGEGLATLENAAKQKEEMMAVMGSRILAQDKRMVEAAETAQIHRAGESATLASIVRSVSDALTRVLELLRDWQGITGEVVVTLNTDFNPTEMDPQMLIALLQALQAGRIAQSDFVYALKQGELLRDDRTAEDITDEVGSTPPSLMGGFAFES